ncbi:MAG: heavy-metal-associated domain-containing protein, partial [Candidatus Methylomirabilales bacterium]
MQIDLQIKGMHCGDCASGVERAISGLPGVKAARVDLGRGTLVVEPEGDGPNLDRIRRQVEALGYQVG